MNDERGTMNGRQTAPSSSFVVRRSPFPPTPGPRPPTPARRAGGDVLVHLAAGVGNVVLATPLLVALSEAGFAVDVLLDADYPPTAELLDGWGVVRRVFAACAPNVTTRDGASNVTTEGDTSNVIAEGGTSNVSVVESVSNVAACRRASSGVAGDGAAGLARLIGRRYDALVPAVPPFYWRRFSRLYKGASGVVARPHDSLFYRDEQEYYFSFARSLGVRARRPVYRLPVGPSDEFGVGLSTLVLAPGSKGGSMRAKRWPHFAELAARFPDVAVVGTDEDLLRADGSRARFPAHARLFVDKLTLRETAALLASAGAVVANDSGLAHAAAAVGTPVLMLFGPTPDRTLGRPAPNVRVLRAGLPCEPCWFTSQLRHCAGRLDCLRALTVDQVEREARSMMGIFDF
jgi:Glycosyltransferase family 9 (heptosyltransferase)